MKIQKNKIVWLYNIILLIILPLSQCKVYNYQQDVAIPNKASDYVIYTNNDSTYFDKMDGVCVKVPSKYRINSIIYGRFANGSDGSISCNSDIYVKNGIRISPDNKQGRVWFNIGLIKPETDSIKLIIAWVDNGWLSARKAIQVFNFKNKSWINIYTWSGNKREEQTTTIKISVQQYLFFDDNCIRIGIFSSSFAVIHLLYILVASKN
jgi:hypothetical protein